MEGHRIRQQRLAAGIPGQVVCGKAGISRGRLSDIEREYVKPREDELRRIEQALEELTRARERVAQVAAEVGWPL